MLRCQKGRPYDLRSIRPLTGSTGERNQSASPSSPPPARLAVTRLLEIRRQALAQQPILIAFATYAAPECRVRAMRAGIDQYLVKPVEPDVLRECLTGWREYFRERLWEPDA